MVAVVFCGDLKYCPYIKRYTERLDAANSNYCVLFWNRGGYDLDLADNYLYYDSPSKLTKGKLQKAMDFLGFRKWLSTTLKKVMPDKIIALSTLTGVLLGAALHKGNVPYIFDIRDYSYEHIPLFYTIEKKVIGHSAFTAISSRGFQAFLPDHNYVIAHNFNRNELQKYARFTRSGGPIRFVWNGVIRYFEYQKKYLDVLKNDRRFEIVFHGDGPELDLFKSYCEENGFQNVIFTGAYNNADKALLLKEADILNNCYGFTKNAGNKLKYAVSNRFYDGMIYHIPQLVEPEGFKPQWAKETTLGTSFLPDECLPDKLYDYYMSIDAVVFDKACEATLNTVLQEDDAYIAKIDAFINA